MRFRSLLLMLGTCSVYFITSASSVGAPTQSLSKTAVEAKAVNADDVRKEIKLAAAEQDIGLVRTLTPILSYTATAVAVLATIVGLAFVSIVVFIIKQLRDLHNERKLNEEALKKVAEHEQRIAAILQQVEQMKIEIRDAALAARQKLVSDEEFTSFIKDVMDEKPTVMRVNFLKDFIWRENISLDQLKPVVLDTELLKSILQRYSHDRETGALGVKSLLQMGMGKEEAIRWVYEIKVKKKTYEQLIQEKETSDQFTSALSRRLFGTSSGLPLGSGPK